MLPKGYSHKKRRIRRGKSFRNGLRVSAEDARAECQRRIQRFPCGSLSHLCDPKKRYAQSGHSKALDVQGEPAVLGEALGTEVVGLLVPSTRIDALVHCWVFRGSPCCKKTNPRLSFVACFDNSATNAIDEPDLLGLFSPDSNNQRAG